MEETPGERMDRNLEPARDLCLDAPFAGTSDCVGLPAAPRQQRAYLLPILLAAAPPRARLAGIATAAIGVAIVIAYATLLPRGGLSESAPALAAVLLAATLSSIAGFAFSAICGVMLLHMISDQVQVVQIMMVCSIAIQSLSVIMLWRDIDLRGLLAFLAGGVVGLPLGVWLLLNLEHVWFKEAVGALLTIYATYVLLKRPVTITCDSRMADAGVGFLGGITGGLAGFPGAAVTIWCGMKDRDKRRQRGIFQPFILVMQVLALLLIQVVRSTASRHVGLGFDPLLYIPVALAGTWLGLAIFRRLSDRSFTLVVNLLLLASGIGLLI